MTEPPARASPARDLHQPLLARMRATRTSSAFLEKGTGRWLAAGILLLVAVILAPSAWPASSRLATTVATVAALTFLLATPGLMMRMGRRAFLVAGTAVLVLYAATASGARLLFLERGDLFVLAVLLGFLVFALAGFNLVFVVEEMVYDAHRYIHLNKSAWMVTPALVMAVLALGIPSLEARTGIQLPATWAASIGAAALLGAWWLVRAFGAWRGGRLLLRELHLFAFSVLLATALADAIQYLKQASHLIPSLTAYVILVGTWVYVTYTTLQRTHFLLKGRDALPWISLLLAASFAIVAHSLELYQVEGHVAVDNLVGQRVTYMVVGVWVGIAFYAGRALWRAARMVTADRSVGPRGRKVARRAQQVVGGVLATERLLEEATVAVYGGIDRMLPGQHQPPERDARPAPAGDAAPAEPEGTTPKP